MGILWAHTGTIGCIGLTCYSVYSVKTPHINMCLWEDHDAYMYMYVVYM